MSGRPNRTPWWRRRREHCGADRGTRSVTAICSTSNPNSSARLPSSSCSWLLWILEWIAYAPPPLIVRAGDNAETVALLAVERHDADVAVLDEPGRFMDAIPMGRLLALLHEEHVDDILRMRGLAAFHPTPPELGGIG
jgi:hypothetical protein